MQSSIDLSPSFLGFLVELRESSDQSGLNDQHNMSIATTAIPKSQPRHSALAPPTEATTVVVASATVVVASATVVVASATVVVASAQSSTRSKFDNHMYRERA